MHSNGLTARSYTPVADLDPRLAASLLADLATQGIAAYTSPVETPSVAGFDRPEFRVDVRDRLYVDAAAADRVRESLQAAGTVGPGADNEDLTWAQIVAGFDQDPTDEVPPWPVQEDVTITAADLTDGTRFLFPDDEEEAEPVELRTADHSRDDDDDVERFVPPPPPPLPALEPIEQIGWVGVLGGPLLFLISALAGFTMPYWVSTVAVVGFVGGFITLVVRMKDSGDDDMNQDSGAIV